MLGYGNNMNAAGRGKPGAGPPRQTFGCSHAQCGATFTRQWKLKDHETVHTGEVGKDPSLARVYDEFVVLVAFPSIRWR